MALFTTNILNELNDRTISMINFYCINCFNTGDSFEFQHFEKILIITVL